MGLKLFSDEDALELEAIKRAILQHEDTFRHQVHELHRLYWTQKNLMSSVSRDGRSTCRDLFGWWSPSLPEKSHFGVGSVLPVECPTSSLSQSFWGGQMCIDFRMPVEEYGRHQINQHLRETGFAYEFPAPMPLVDLTLGVGSGCNVGKNDGKSSKEGYLNGREVIDLDNSAEMEGDDEGVVVTSFGPKTPNIFSESRRECNQPRSCVMSASMKMRKHLDCDIPSYPLSAGQSTTTGDISGNQFTTKQRFSHAAELFDLNTVMPEESDTPVCVVREISSVVDGSSVGHCKSVDDSCTNVRDVQSESSSYVVWKTLAVASADGSNSTSLNSTLMSNTELPPVSNSEGILVASSQQSSNGSSPSLLPDLEKPVCGDGADPSAVDRSVVRAQPLADMELSSRRSSFGRDLRDNSDVLGINLVGNKTASDSEKPILEGGETYGCYETDDGREAPLRWPDVVDGAILMASASLVHMSLEHPIHSEKDKRSELPQSSLDSMERIVLALQEHQEAECSSPFKPAEGSGANSKSRYRSRSGRKLRDFQKDVLPSIVALSRHEICEDMHAFTEIVGPNEPRKKGAARGSFRPVGRGRMPRRR